MCPEKRLTKMEFWRNPRKKMTQASRVETTQAPNKWEKRHASLMETTTTAKIQIG